MNSNAVAVVGVATRSVTAAATTVQALFAAKLENAKTAFLQDFLDSGFTVAEVNAITIVDVMTELLSVRMYWDMIRSRNLEFFLVLSAAKPPPGGLTDDELNDWLRHKQMTEEHVSRMSPTKLDLMWRYANLFVNCVVDLTK